MRNRNFKFYLANLWIEVERMFQFYQKDDEKFLGAIQRFLDLYLKALSKANTDSRKKELARIKESVLDYFFWDNTYKSTKDSLLKYFKVFYY